VSTPGPHDCDEEPALDDVGPPQPDDSPEQLARQRAADVAVVETLRRVGFDTAHPLGQALVKQLRELGAGTLIMLWRSASCSHAPIGWG
jgi:hypothetical protein